jgi:hypothetical protein
MTAVLLAYLILTPPPPPPWPLAWPDTVIVRIC